MRPPAEDAAEQELEPDLPTTVDILNIEKPMSNYSSDELDDVGEEFEPSISQSQISIINQRSPSQTTTSKVGGD